MPSVEKDGAFGIIPGKSPPSHTNRCLQIPRLFSVYCLPPLMGRNDAQNETRGLAALTFVCEVLSRRVRERVDSQPPTKDINCQDRYKFTAKTDINSQAIIPCRTHLYDFMEFFLFERWWQFQHLIDFSQVRRICHSFITLARFVPSTPRFKCTWDVLLNTHVSEPKKEITKCEDDVKLANKL